MNYVDITDNALSDTECNFLIKEYTPKIKKSLKAPHNYSYLDIESELVDRLSKKLIDEYVKKYPAINLTFDKWSVGKFTFKKFKPGSFYNAFHSEQSINDPRVLSILIYLSNHNCGTEFFNGFVVQSIKGRAMLFPPYWTHTHKGQPCPDKKPRYILSAYATFDKQD
jgi:hypothetical protein